MHHRHTSAAPRRHTYPDPSRALRHLHRQRAAARRPSEFEQHLARQATAALDALGDTASTFVRRAARLGVPAHRCACGEAWPDTSMGCGHTPTRCESSDGRGLFDPDAFTADASGASLR